MRRRILISSFASLVVGIAGVTSLHAVKSVRGNLTAKSTVQGAVITGRVINLEGQNVAGADVFAVSARGSRGMRPHTMTDSKGNFTIPGLTPETRHCLPTFEYRNLVTKSKILLKSWGHKTPPPI